VYVIFATHIRNLHPANDHFMTAETCGEGEGACHAHQIVLEILTETGVIGLALWLAWCGLWHCAHGTAQAMHRAHRGVSRVGIAARDAFSDQHASGLLFGLVGLVVRVAAGPVVRGALCCKEGH
jgi:hypothetical protein